MLSGCATAPSSRIDPRSYQLGIIAGFAEVVHLGVKTLALSERLDAEVHDFGEASDDAELVRAGIDSTRGGCGATRQHD
ncbi:MAG: hypothetical protein AAFZ18_09280, partial [Myxococcota bacterium]